MGCGPLGGCLAGGGVEGGLLMTPQPPMTPPPMRDMGLLLSLLLKLLLCPAGALTEPVTEPVMELVTELEMALLPELPVTVFACGCCWCWR